MQRFGCGLRVSNCGFGVEGLGLKVHALVRGVSLSSLLAPRRERLAARLADVTDPRSLIHPVRFQRGPAGERREGVRDGGGGGEGGRKTLTQGGFPAGWPREEGVSEEAGKGSGFADALPVPAPTRPVAPGSPGLGGAGGQGLPTAAGETDIWARGGGAEGGTG